jgi:hypothetical protein
MFLSTTRPDISISLPKITRNEGGGFSWQRGSFTKTGGTQSLTIGNTTITRTGRDVTHVGSSGSTDGNGNIDVQGGSHDRGQAKWSIGHGD